MTPMNDFLFLKWKRHLCTHSTIIIIYRCYNSKFYKNNIKNNKAHMRAVLCNTVL